MQRRDMSDLGKDVGYQLLKDECYEDVAYSATQNIRQKFDYKRWSCNYKWSDEVEAGIMARHHYIPEAMKIKLDS